MSTYTVTSDDTLTLQGRILMDFADGDTSAITYTSDKATMKTGKNRNTIYAQNAAGDNAQLVVRLQRGSSDDVFLQGLLNSQYRDFVSAALINGEFVKRLGDGFGGVKRDVGTLLAGIFTRNVEMKENVDGDVEQAVSVYTIGFAQAKRTIQ